MKLFNLRQAFILKDMSIFCLLLPLFLYTAQCLHNDATVLNIKNFLHYFSSHYFEVLFVIPCAWGVSKRKMFSRYLFIALMGYVTIRSGILIFLRFDILFLFMLFFTIIISHYFYLLLGRELKNPAYVPKYSEHDFHERSGPDVKVSVSFAESADSVYVAKLTNWGHYSCFFKLQEALPDLFNPLIKHKKVSPIKVVLEFKGRQFTASGQVVSVYGDFCGFGVEFSKEESKQSRFDWKEFCSILDEFAYEAKFFI